MNKFCSYLNNSFNNHYNNIFSATNIVFNIFHTVFRHISKLAKYGQILFYFNQLI